MSHLSVASCYRLSMVKLQLLYVNGDRNAETLLPLEHGEVATEIFSMLGTDVFIVTA